MAAGLLTGGACVGKWVIVVGEDIDPSNFEAVWTAICLRADIEKSVDIARGFLNSGLDPSLSPEKKASGDIMTAKVLIDACKPWHWREKFSKPIHVSKELIREACELFGQKEPELLSMAPGLREFLIWINTEGIRPGVVSELKETLGPVGTQCFITRHGRSGFKKL